VEAQYRVLLVEDEAPLKRSLEKFLERSGYPYDSCCTARDALNLARLSRYDIIILEYHLPDANGGTLLRELKLISPDMASIVISEFDYPNVAADLLKVNVRSFLKKPFDVAELESAMISASSRKCLRSRKPEWEQLVTLECSSASILLRELSDY